MQTEEYYCTDNFFKKMTDLESPRKNNDCYFYYYSTCSKGDSCGFRHEPSALGCETVCSFWKEGKCLNVHCNFRHMELKKNRKAIPCYWESQPGGCLKPHCPFMHHATATSTPSENAAELNKSEAVVQENCTQANNYRSTKTVDKLIVSFEDETLQIISSLETRFRRQQQFRLRASADWRHFCR
uniref:C3H1-type domain-containing protein n=1 Tax=Dendroctonus ponderosae TaxID=77166 RepID=A0AAR5P7W3_DENPD